MTNIGQIIIVHKDLCRKIVKFSWLVLCNDCSLRIRNLNEKLVIEVSNIYFMIVKVWEDLDISLGRQNAPNCPLAIRECQHYNC